MLQVLCGWCSGGIGSGAWMAGSGIGCLHQSSSSCLDSGGVHRQPRQTLPLNGARLLGAVEAVDIVYRQRRGARSS